MKTTTKVKKPGSFNIFSAFIQGDWKTKLSYVWMGAGNLFRGQIARGLVFLIFEIVFFMYLFTNGVSINGNYLSVFGHVLTWTSGLYWITMLSSLGLEGPGETYDPFYDQYIYKFNDNSFQILLYGILTILLILGFVLLWYLNIKMAKEAQDLQKAGKKLNKMKDDIKSLVDEGFYKTLLALPVTGIIVFTMLPILFMILIAFTNYDGTHDGYVTNLFTWQGWDNFKALFAFNGTGSYGKIFAGILGWTIIWAIFATFSNYFLGILVALMINRKSIKFKKLWRTIFVLTIAIPQFISLLYVSKMFDKSGIVNGLLIKWGWITQPLPFWTDPTWARVLIILINIWIGVPYLMLIATGILMNIPQDLYEAATIDGASPVQQFRHITMPYMLFVTGPYLLTSFTGNMNNFNVIYLLTGGGPTNAAASSASGSVGYTDLLVTWLFKITQGANSEYYMASVIGIIIFIIVSLITLVVYNLLPSNKNEEDMQ